MLDGYYRHCPIERRTSPDLAPHWRGGMLVQSLRKLGRTFHRSSDSLTTPHPFGQKPYPARRLAIRDRCYLGIFWQWGGAVCDLSNRWYFRVGCCVHAGGESGLCRLFHAPLLARAPQTARLTSNGSTAPIASISRLAYGIFCSTYRIAFSRARFLQSERITVHGASAVSVCANIASLACV